MSIKDNIKKELLKLIKTEFQDLENIYSDKQYKWCMRNQFDADRYDLGYMKALEEELRFLEKLVNFANSL